MSIPIPSDRLPAGAAALESLKLRILEGGAGEDEEVINEDSSEPLGLETDISISLPHEFKPAKSTKKIKSTIDPAPLPKSTPWLLEAGEPIDFSVTKEGFTVNLKARILGKRKNSLLIVLSDSCGFEPAFGVEFDACINKKETLRLIFLDHYYEFRKEHAIIVGFQIVQESDKDS